MRPRILALLFLLITSVANVSAVDAVGQNPLAIDLITHRIELGTLPAGQYNVVARYDGGQAPVTLSFPVLDANPTVLVSQSIGSSAGGTTASVVVAASHCLVLVPTTCPPPAITFGGMPATDVVTIDGSHFRATTPPHALGAVEVRVTGDSFVKS